MRRIVSAWCNYIGKPLFVLVNGVFIRLMPTHWSITTDQITDWNVGHDRKKESQQKKSEQKKNQANERREKTLRQIDKQCRFNKGKNCNIFLPLSISTPFLSSFLFQAQQNHLQREIGDLTACRFRMLNFRVTKMTQILHWFFLNFDKLYFPFKVQFFTSFFLSNLIAESRPVSFFWRTKYEKIKKIMTKWICLMCSCIVY